MKGWIGVDFDGTLAHYEKWVGAAHAGEPIEPMVARVRTWLSENRDVRIFTARIFPYYLAMPNEKPMCLYHAAHPQFMHWTLDEAQHRLAEAMLAIHTVQNFCMQQFGQLLPITNVKDFGMIMLYDDRCRQIRPNLGTIVGEED